MKKFTLLLVLCTMGMISLAQELDIQSLKSMAEQGDTEAQFVLYNCYVSGQQVEKNDEMALSYLFQAADNQHAEALYVLGCCYKNGEMGLPKWKEKAEDYLSQASELGYTSSRNQLDDLVKGYSPFKKIVRKTVCEQVILVAPKSQSADLKRNKSKFLNW